MCREHATVRGVLGELMEESSGGIDDVIVDMEAGLEHLSRGTGRHVDLMLAVVEPYYRALETGARVVTLAEELEVGRVAVVANKVRDEADRDAVRDYCDGRDLPVLQEVPYDRSLVEAERCGMAPIDHDASAPAVDAVRSLGGHLVSERM